MSDKLPRASTSGKNRQQRSPSPYRLSADHPPEIAQFVNDFWQHTITTAEKVDDDFKHQALPLARIKKVMKSDPEVRMISSEVTILFEKACQIFIQELTARSHLVSLANRRRTLAQPDVAQAIIKSDMFDFLIDIVPRDDGQQDNGNSNSAAAAAAAAAAAVVNAETRSEAGGGRKGKGKKGKSGKGKEKAAQHAMENSGDDDERSPEQDEEGEEEEEEEEEDEEEEEEEEASGGNGQGEHPPEKRFKNEESHHPGPPELLYEDHGHGRVGMTNQETENLLLAQLQHDHNESQFGAPSHWPQGTFDFHV